MRDDELIDTIREHAVEHYNEDGWDILVDFWDDDIRFAARGCKNARQAIRTIRKSLRVIADVNIEREPEYN